MADLPLIGNTCGKPGKLESQKAAGKPARARKAGKPESQKARKLESWKAWKASQPGQLASWASQESQKARKLESIIKLAKWQTSSKLANNWQKCKKTTFENLKIVRVEG